MILSPTQSPLYRPFRLLLLQPVKPAKYPARAGKHQELVTPSGLAVNRAAFRTGTYRQHADTGKHGRKLPLRAAAFISGYPSSSARGLKPEEPAFCFPVKNRNIPGLRSISAASSKLSKRRAASSSSKESSSDTSRHSRSCCVCCRRFSLRGLAERGIPTTLGTILILPVL